MMAIRDTAPVDAMRGAQAFDFVLGISSHPAAPAMVRLASAPVAGSDVIDAHEFQALLGVLAASDVVLAPGRFAGDEPVYFVEIGGDGASLSGGLGYDAATLALVTRLADALRTGHRAGFDAHIAFLQRAVAG